MFGLNLPDPFTSDQTMIKLMPWELQLMDAVGGYALHGMPTV